MVKNWLKNLYYISVIASGAERRAERRINATNRVAVLNLHRVNPDINPYWPALHPDVFTGLLAHLVSRFDVVSLEEARSDVPRERPMAVLSFDDGYSDFIEYALPIMDKWGVCSNLNVIADCALTGRPIWNVRLYDFLRSAPKEMLGRVKLPGFRAKAPGDSDYEKMRFGLKLSSFLKSRPRNERADLFSMLEPLFEDVATDQTRMMTCTDISSLPDSVEVGAHSYSHESMGFESDNYFTDDLQKCFAFFANELDRQLETYAFPNGSYRNGQIHMLQQLGIRNVLLVDERLATPVNGVFTRITIYGSTHLEARMRALGYR